MVESYSVYPDQIDGYTTLPLRKNLVHEIRAEDHNRLRDAIIKIEQELGIQPSGSFATVASRLDSIGDANALIEAHLIDPDDAHDAGAISLLDTADNYVAANVEDALAELAAVLPVPLDVIGADNEDIPNSGIPDFVNKEGRLWVFNTSDYLPSVVSSNEVQKTQPIEITGIQIVEVGEANGEGSGALLIWNATSESISWQAPGDTAGALVDISDLDAGETVILESGTTSKKIKIARTTASLNLFDVSTPGERFDVYKLNARTGAYSHNTVGIRDSNYIINTAIDALSTSNAQAVISGFVFPADKGILVLQRKLKVHTQFFPIAVLNLSDSFDESLRADGQPVYTPTLSQFDTIMLYDRQPARKNYQDLEADTNGDPIYDNFEITADFIPFQVAKYIIPISNSPVIGGGLESPINISNSEIINSIGTYRIVHYISGITDFNGNPDPSNIYSVSDVLGSEDDGDNTVRMSNVFLDNSASQRPDVATNFIIRPIVDAEVLSKTISGIHYYNSPDDLFDLEIASDTALFNKTYLRNDILRFTTDAFAFPTSDGYSSNIPVNLLRDDGYVLFSDTNLPDHATAGKDRGYYLINSTFNTTKRLYPNPDNFSSRAHVAATFYDPFGPGATSDAYGLLSGVSSPLRMLINSHSRFRATETEEFFTDESMRVGPFRSLSVVEDFLFELEADQFTHVYGSNGDGYTLAPWHNNVPLDSYLDSNTIITANSLQCGGRFSADFIYAGLIYPQDDYSTVEIRPLQSGSVNYSSFVGDRYYQRVFSLNRTTNGGKLRVVSAGSSPISFDDISTYSSNRFGKIEVKIPGTGENSTEWLDLGKLFETGKFEDGDGALIAPLTGQAGDFTVSFTFGERNTADSGNMIAVRVTYFGSDVSHISTSKTKILTYLQLLEP